MLHWGGIRLISVADQAPQCVAFGGAVSAAGALRKGRGVQTAVGAVAVRHSESNVQPAGGAVVALRDEGNALMAGDAAVVFRNGSNARLAADAAAAPLGAVVGGVVVRFPVVAR